MSAWKRNALELLPEYRKLIVDAANPMALWIDLYSEFQEIYRAEAPDPSVIRRFFKFASWCRSSRGQGKFLSDAGTAAVCAFYEHLPVEERVRRDLPKWISKGEFGALREVFRYHLSETEFGALESEFLGPGSKLQSASKPPRRAAPGRR